MRRHQPWRSASRCRRRMKRPSREKFSALHGLYPADESTVAAAMPGASGLQPGLMPAGPIQTASAVPTNGSPNSAAPGQIEQWPYSPQAAITVSTVSHAPATANDFDPMPVEEYRAAVAKATGDANSLPAFQQAASDSNAADSQSVTATIAANCTSCRRPRARRPKPSCSDPDRPGGIARRCRAASDAVRPARFAGAEPIAARSAS